jgi:MoaA/NifB/PqqE/SkfB family radical SAM enzyme
MSRDAMIVDQRLAAHLKGLSQVFLYITDACDLHCQHCLNKPFLKSAREVELDNAMRLLTVFRRLGAFKLTLIGGEPTMYGRDCEWMPLRKLLVEARDVGYSYIRMDTNGRFPMKFLELPEVRLFDELTFSIDGACSREHDLLRGRGAFGKTIERLRGAAAAGYRVQITCCMHNGMTQGSDVDHALERMIRFAEREGASQVNFHPLFKVGAKRDSWTGDTEIAPRDWMMGYEVIRRRVEQGAYSIDVRLPQRFVSVKEHRRRAEYFDYCPVRDGERVLIHPDGSLRICALNIGAKSRIGYFDREAMLWEEEHNELEACLATSGCANQRGVPDGTCALCMSFKPRQVEPVWNRIRSTEPAEPGRTEDGRADCAATG